MFKKVLVSMLILFFSVCCADEYEVARISCFLYNNIWEKYSPSDIILTTETENYMVFMYFPDFSGQSFVIFPRDSSNTHLKDAILKYWKWKKKADSLKVTLNKNILAFTTNGAYMNLSEWKVSKLNITCKFETIDGNYIFTISCKEPNFNQSMTKIYMNEISINEMWKALKPDNMASYIGKAMDQAAIENQFN